MCYEYCSVLRVKDVSRPRVFAPLRALCFPTGDSDASISSQVAIVVSSPSPEKPPRSGQGFV